MMINCSSLRLGHLTTPLRSLHFELSLSLLRRLQSVHLPSSFTETRRGPRIALDAFSNLGKPDRWPYEATCTSLLGY
jgi:hypothetical protein